MQTRINSTQPRFIEGMTNPELPFLPLPRYTEDENCQAGKFVFEGSNPETSAVSTKEGATKDNIIGIVKRTPFQSYFGAYDDVYAKGTNITVVARGNICITATNTPKYKDKVFVNPSTREIQTGSGDAPAGFIETGFRVTQTPNCGNTVEVSNVQFN